VSDQGGPRDFNDFARRLIKRKARQLVGWAGLRLQDVPDIEQEIAARLLRGLRQFDPDRAPRDAFVRHLVDNAVATLLRDRRAGKRRVPTWTGPATPADEVLDHTNARIARDRELAADVQLVLDRLPARVRSLAERLMAGDSKAAAARLLGRKRTTLYREVGLLRAAFERATLRYYL
jgi:DNA-directed RNA polymerase specialized sigma24 family protein